MRRSLVHQVSKEKFPNARVDVFVPLQDGVLCLASMLFVTQ